MTRAEVCSNGLLVHVPAVSPRELTGTTALRRGTPPGARGGIQILGMERINMHMNNALAVTAVVDAAALSCVDPQKFVAHVQSRPLSNDVDDEVSAPLVVACKSHTSNIVDVLSDFVDKAQTKFDDTRHAESNVAHNFSMLQLFLEDQLAQLNRALKKAKADVAEFTTSLDAEKADLVEAEKSLSASVASQASGKSSCGQVASEHEALVKGFAEEIKAWADATQVLQSETGGAEGQFRFRDVVTLRRTVVVTVVKASRQGRTLCLAPSSRVAHSAISCAENR